jgi:hypothetical protein
VKRIAIPFHQHVTADQTIVIACPMYRQLPVSWLFNWWRLQAGGQMGLSHCIGLVAVEGARLPIAMQRIVSTALQKFPTLEWLVVWEDDIEPPLDAFDRVASYDDRFDIVGSLNFMHEPPYRPTAFTLGGTETEPTFDHVPPEVLRAWVADPGLKQVDAVAMGFTAIRRRVLDAVDPVQMWQPVWPMQGQDIQACWTAGKQGFRVALDPQMHCGHLTERSIGYQDSEAGSCDGDVPAAGLRPSATVAD